MQLNYMIQAPTLLSVIEALQASFFKNRVKSENPLEQRYSLFRPGDMLEKVPLTDKIKLIGILFMHPDSDLVKKDIIPRFGLYHQRAGEFTDFYFAGYGAYWPEFEYPDQRFILELDGTRWLYSDRAFNAFRREIQAKTSWTYSGETDLILTTAKYSSARKRGDLDFSQCITCCLEQLIRDGGITSIPNLFERIFHFGETRPSASVNDFSDLHLVRNSKISLLEWILSRLGLKDYYNHSKGMAIRNIAKTS